MQFLFLNNALNHFLQTIQNVWAPVFQMQGIQILLAISAIAFAVYAIQLVATHDVPAFILGFGYTIISLAFLHAVFLYSQEFATAVLNGFLQWGQQTSNMSPAALTPSGIAESGLTLARIFWAAGGHASWLLSPISALEQLICMILVVVTFGIASIIYLLAQVEVWALIIAASVLLAFAALPWTWSMFPGWALTVLSACIKVFFLLAVLAVGLNEAAAWATAMGAVSGTIADNISLMMQATVESILLLGLVFYIPNLMARMVVGGAGTAIHAGEAIIGSIGGAASGGAINAAGSAASKAAARGGKALATVSKMLLR
jgi:P-type conjugative transfer protein TrbL